MTQSQSRSTSPANWHPGMPEREGLWIFTGMRDFIDNIANTSPARLALTAFGVVILLFTGLLSLPASSATGDCHARCTRPSSPLCPQSASPA